MVVTAHPLATRAALDMLAAGGAPIDAAIAAQMVLGLVEPQSSGIGGGALAMLWDAQRRELSSWDGLAAAPSRATPGLAVDVDGSKLDDTAAQRGGRSVGVPGTLALLETLHQRHGKLPWPSLFAPAIAPAEQGFAMPPYLHRVLSAPGAAADHAQMRALYVDERGKVLPVGATVRNAAYARTLRAVAELGAQGWLAAGAARAIVQAAQGGYRASLMNEADLLAYRAAQREPLCAPFLRWRVCMMGPSSYGGVAVLQMLQMLQDRVLVDSSNRAAATAFDFDDPAFVHLYVEVGRLAQADRLRHVGDPAFVNVPTKELLSPAYLHQRALTIQSTHAARSVAPGRLPARGIDAPAEAELASSNTSQIAIVDAHGNALSITTTINLNFGSRLMVDGFVLNNAMSNFAPAPAAGQTRANQMAPLRRPTSSMAPTMVFDAAGTPVVVGGSAGGGQIVDYIAQSLIEMLARDATPAQALARGHVSTAVAGSVQLERGSTAARLAPALTALGHKVEVTEMTSGLGFIKRVAPQAWIGAADPRRDGVALGQ